MREPLYQNDLNGVPLPNFSLTLPRIIIPCGVLCPDRTIKATAIIHALGVSGDKADVVLGLLTASFRPGSLIADLTTNGVSLPKDRDAFVTLLLSSSVQQPAAQFAQNGFWSDHWAYTLDLADNFVSIYPDEREWLMYDAEPLPSFIAPALVKNRVDRYQVGFQPPNIDIVLSKTLPLFHSPHTSTR